MSAIYQGLHSRPKWKFLQNPKTTPPSLCDETQVIFHSMLKNGGAGGAAGGVLPLFTVEKE